MKKFYLIIFSLVLAYTGRSQKIDSIYFHLYTDSLKKGTYNYINVDGKTSDGRWKPLTAKEIDFSASACQFSGTELVVPADFSGDRITVRAVLKANPAVAKEITIWVKKLPDPPLPTRDEMNNGRPKRRNR